ncbi:sugar transferase [Phenylobacterium montanum]|uniref:Sugar transferase n=1 Tax=Phenylobacterium montanum TaxID=2823693 RepID=A0A975FYE1_9CAUL|nr:sugar transferase [Caulobacter sp. S6]QUD87456.1 sugar transferase [Caulobacter sp. S6]
MRSAERIVFDEGWARALEIGLCLSILIFFAPLMAVVAVLIKLDDGGPVLFAHPRIGRFGRTFPCFKFRSMAVDAEAQLQALLARDPAARAEWERDHKLTCDPRITPLGQFLRRSSLDELPQLLNVLRGEMSLVGPRPIVQAEIARYRRYFRYYCQMRPGITGLWQVSGRSDLRYRRRVALDVIYARSRCLGLDFKILLATAPAVLGRRGAR